MTHRYFVTFGAALALAFSLAAQKPEPRINNTSKILQDTKKTQTLDAPRESPLVAIGQTSKLVFHVSPLSGEGLLSQQTRDAVKAILKLNGGAQIVHIRAFSAGNGDIRRIPQIVADVLTDQRIPLPSISIVQAGALPLGDAQVVLEAVSLSKRDVNKEGLTFHPLEEVPAQEPASPIKPLLQKSIDQLAAKMNGRRPLAVTCFVSLLDNGADFSHMIASRFPGAAVNLVQPRRLAWQASAGCEGVSQGGGTSAPNIAFSGTQVGFGVEEKDAILAVQRLDRALTEAGAPRASAALVRLYLISPATSPIAMKQLEGSAPVASYAVEGVGPVDAGFAIDAVSPVH
jgi:hypothetical protein